MKWNPFDPRVFSHFNWQLFFVTLAIMFLAMMNLYSATLDLPIAKYFTAQMVYCAGGLVLMLLLTVVHYRVFEKLGYFFYVLNILLLILTMVKGRAALGAQRWLDLGFISIQPSEISKLAVLFGVAKLFHDRHDGRPMSLQTLFFPLVMILVPFVLILKQPDLGTSLIVLFSSGTCLLFMGIQRKIIITSAIMALLLAPVGWSYVLKPYQKDRITTFMDPEKHALGKGYQVIQSKIAIGSGELTGKGYLRGTQAKLQFLPKQHTDFVFSNFGEEFGFIGTTFVLILYTAMTILGLQIAQNSRDIFGMVLGIGCTALLGLQVIINIAMEVGMLPVVGVTLPLFSYGGTSLLTTLITIGLLLNISMRSYIF